jgi:hypothetical protein
MIPKLIQQKDPIVYKIILNNDVGEFALQISRPTKML